MKFLFTPPQDLPSDPLNRFDKVTIQSEAEPPVSLVEGEEELVLLHDVAPPAGVDAVPPILHSQLGLFNLKQFSRDGRQFS